MSQFTSSKPQYRVLDTENSIESSDESQQGYDCEPGLCVIINNMNFRSKGLRNLPGGEVDQKQLQLAFTYLNFEVKGHVHVDLTADEITETVKSYSEKTHKGAFAMVILSHGGRGDVVYGTDGGTVEVRNLTEFFSDTNCPSLRGLPKIFLIDACRGNGRKPDTSDISIVYASAPGRVAYINNKGSRFTQCFVDTILEAKPDEDFATIVTTVRQQIKEVQVVDCERMTNKYFIKRNTAINSVQKNSKKFKEAVKMWTPTREKTIQDIQTAIDKLIEHRKNVNIARITGACVSIAGAGAAILGFALTPVTFGGSIAIAAAGVGVAAAGGAAAAGASGFDMFIQHSNLKDAQKQLDRDVSEYKVIAEIAAEIKKEIDAIETKCPGIDKTTIIAFTGEVIAHSFVRVGNIGIKGGELAVLGILELGALALRVGGVAAKAVAAVGLVLNVLLIPIDIIEITRAAWNMHKGNENPAVVKLRETLCHLEEQKAKIEKMI